MKFKAVNLFDSLQISFDLGLIQIDQLALINKLRISWGDATDKINFQSRDITLGIIALQLID